MGVVVGKRSRVKRRFCLKREGKKACLYVDSKIVNSKMLMIQERGQNC